MVSVRGIDDLLVVGSYAPGTGSAAIPYGQQAGMRPVLFVSSDSATAFGGSTVT
jgi:hypothetical protein